MMKSVRVASIGIVVLALLVLSNTTMAQQGRGFRGQTAYVISDVLLLDQEKTDKVVSIYNEVSSKRFEEMRNSQVDWRNMSDQERTEYFNKFQKSMADDLKTAYKELLSEKELAAVETIVTKRIFSPDAEIRGLRLIGLTDEQKQKIQPMTIELCGKMVPAGTRFSGSQMSEEEREKAQKAYQEAKTDLIAKVNEMLTDEQKAAWKEKTAEAQKEIDETRQQMQNRSQQ